MACYFALGFRCVGILLGMIFFAVTYGVVEGDLVSRQKSLEFERHAVKTIQVCFLYQELHYYFDDPSNCFYFI